MWPIELTYEVENGDREPQHHKIHLHLDRSLTTTEIRHRASWVWRVEDGLLQFSAAARPHTWTTFQEDIQDAYKKALASMVVT